LEILFEIHQRLINHTPLGFIRSLFYKINWESTLIEIRGARGVGKTTLMLQYIKSDFEEDDTSVLYFSADDPYFYSHSIIETIDTFVKYGGQHIFIDEVHKYIPKHEHSDWSSEIKAVYDRYPGLKIVYSGSSIIQLHKGIGDLSRRVSIYNLSGLSFREYLEYNNILKHEAIDLETILNQHKTITQGITSKILILPAFREYLKHGYYPFYNEDKEKYYEKLKNVISVIMETDIPSVIDIPFVSVNKMKKLLSVLTTSSPFTPNLTAVGKKIGITDQRTLLKYMNYLEKSLLIRSLRRKAIGNSVLRKPEKVFIANTNFAYALDSELVNKGTLREIFFYSQVADCCRVNLPKHGDFILNNKYIFEIGGKNKNKEQLRNLKNAFFVLDDIEQGIFNKIPLWLFGFLY